MEERLKIQLVDSFFKHNGNSEPVKVSWVNVNPSARIKLLMSRMAETSTTSWPSVMRHLQWNQVNEVKLTW